MSSLKTPPRATEKLEDFMEGLFVNKKVPRRGGGRLIQQLLPEDTPIQLWKRLDSKDAHEAPDEQAGLSLQPQANEYKVQYYRKCEDQAAEGKYRPFINTIASCCERSFDSRIEHLRTVEVKKKEKERIRPETMVDVSYVFDLVLDNTKYIQDMRKINSPNDVRRLQSLVSNMEKGYKAMREDER